MLGEMGIVVVAQKCSSLSSVVQEKLKAVNTGVVLEDVHIDVETEVDKTA